MMSDPKQPNRKANFFLVGAPKAGTTSVDRLLRGHPDVFLSPIKEPCHFCPDVNTQLASAYKDRDRVDISAYLASPSRDVVHFCEVSSPDDYSRLFDCAGDRRIVGECSTYYLSSKIAPGKIHAYNPDAKILVLVRNPIDRIHSHYAMDRSLGFVSGPLLSHVEEELALGDDANWGNCRFYVGASRYSRQIEEFGRYFARENICVVSFEKLIADPDTELRRLFRFLDIAEPQGHLVLPIENKSRAARFPRLHGGLRKSGLKPVISGWLKNSMTLRLSQAARSVYYRGQLPSVSDEDRDRIAALLCDEGLDFDMARAA